MIILADDAFILLVSRQTQMCVFKRLKTHKKHSEKKIIKRNGVSLDIDMDWIDK